MRDSIKLTLIAIFVITVDVLLCQIIPALNLLELILTFVAMLLISAGVSMLYELIHQNRCQQERREIELELLRRQLLPSVLCTFRPRKARRSRNVRSRFRR